jgi:hypothetical protein
VFLIGEKTFGSCREYDIIKRHCETPQRKYDMFTEKYRTDEMCQLKYLKGNEKSAKILVSRMSKNLSPVLYWLI